MRLYDKFGWVIEVEKYLSSWEYDRSPAKVQYVIPDKKQSVAASACNVAICYYLLNDQKESVGFARETTSAVLEYYYGQWKSQIPTRMGMLDPEYWRLHRAWTDFFRYGLCWASAIGDWASARRIAQYPVDGCKVDSTYTKEDKAAYLALASFLREEPVGMSQHYFQQIDHGKKEKPKLIAEVIKALRGKNAVNFQAALEDYLKYFRKREFKKKSLDKLLCFDGTTLMNIGKRDGLDFAIPAKIEDHIIILKPM